jgi:aspartyl-tRNA(Asn)/glutamyl-tRNA(Gln) amidotransferase subunit A
MDPTLLTVAEASHAIAEGRLSPVELTDAYLDRIDALDGELHSYVLVLHDAARSAAREIAAGRSRGALHGIPIGLKDIYKTRGIRTTAGSPRYLDHVPDEDAESWVKLRDAGAILLGKQETHEFAIGGPDFTLPFPPARNPWNTAHYRRGRRAARRSRLPPAFALRRWDRIPAARSAGRPPITVLSASSRPMAGLAGAASSRYPIHSITAAR